MAEAQVIQSQWMVILDGGPAGITRVRRVTLPPTEELIAGGRVRIDHAGKHQHFEFRGQRELLDGEHLPVFVWIYATAVAE